MRARTLVQWPKYYENVCIKYKVYMRACTLVQCSGTNIMRMTL